MSRIKFDSNVSSDDAHKNLSLDWGYAPAPTEQPESTRRRPRNRKKRELKEIARAMDPAINFISMTAGVATSIAIIAWVANTFTTWAY